MSNNSPLGIGNHQTRISAGIVKRRPISKNGGKYSIAGFAITKPNPNNIGTINAINMSLVFIFLILVKSKKAMLYFIFKNAFNKNRTKI